MLSKLKAKNFDVLALHHAEAIVTKDMGTAETELESVLSSIKAPVEELVLGGGGEGKLTQRIRHELADKYGWKKHNFKIEKTVDGKVRESITHEIDHVKDFGGWKFALEIEWNNKDPFFDRDLENFQRLHADGVISIGCIITRGRSLQDSLVDLIEVFANKNAISSAADLSRYYNPTSRQLENYGRAAKQHGTFARGWAHAFVADKFGKATTHWEKLEDRVKRGVGNPCPLLLIGIPKDVIFI